MNTIKQLIQQYCPDGVEYKKLGEVCERIKGTPITAALMKEISTVNGEVKIFAGGKTIIDAHEKDIPKANITRVPSIIVQSRGVIDFVFYDKPFTFKNEMWAYTHPQKVTVKYLYFFLKTKVPQLRQKASKMGSLPQISIPDTQNLSIPLPPLPIQRKIVEILDNFTELEAELETELEAEMEARKKQYTYYRDKLLSQKTFSTRVKKLGEVFNMKAGTHINASEINGLQFDDFSYPCYGGNGIRGFVKKANKKGPTPIIGRQGALCGNVQFSEGEYYATEHAVVVEPKDKNIDMRWAFYKLQEMDLNQYKSQGAQPGLAVGKLEMLSIPVPPLSEQRRIVSILDRFESLVNDISSGLPAEIKARHQQYEYYRDQLLSFKRKRISR